jgi:hypothetical protein
MVITKITYPIAIIGQASLVKRLAFSSMLTLEQRSFLNYFWQGGCDVEKGCILTSAGRLAPKLYRMDTWARP